MSTRSSRQLAPAGWVKCTARRTPNSAAAWPSRSCPRRSASDPIASARFEREVNVLASLNHPHIAGVHGFEESGGRHFLVMELVDGETLEARLTASAQARRSEVARVAEVARDRAPDRQGARSRARAGHRPSRSQTGEHEDHARRQREGAGLRAREGDGVPRRRADSSAAGLTHSPTLTSPAATQRRHDLGTAPYMSPEQAKGRRPTSAATCGRSGACSTKCSTGRPRVPTGR